MLFAAFLAQEAALGNTVCCVFSPEEVVKILAPRDLINSADAEFARIVRCRVFPHADSGARSPVFGAAHPRRAQRFQLRFSCLLQVVSRRLKWHPSQELPSEAVSESGSPGSPSASLL